MIHGCYKPYDRWPWENDEPDERTGWDKFVDNAYDIVRIGVILLAAAAVVLLGAFALYALTFMTLLL